jgi:hypothetical protein
MVDQRFVSAVPPPGSIKMEITDGIKQEKGKEFSETPLLLSLPVTSYVLLLSVRNSYLQLRSLLISKTRSSASSLVRWTGDAHNTFQTTFAMHRIGLGTSFPLRLFHQIWLPLLVQVR